MDFYQLIKTRRSVRKYESRPVEEEKLMRILNAARLAPSGKNAQAWKFIVVKDQELKEKIVKAAKGQKFLAEADCIIVCCVNEEEVYQGHGNYMTSFAVDGAIAMDHLILAAHYEGLGTCWIGAFFEDQIKEILNIPDPYRVVAMTPLGYPAGEQKDRGRKPLEEIIAFDGWKW
ncbi:nitroreductase [Anoxybacter fermentans]|uniref:Nitroreductase n=1 Tax=Anoxybacter fermentans TaxID=1323375 RepID=A0A3S9SVH9_9FIRM|nr:nitroreductase family protein [Anoxybacter fermentans]AZR72285.1 nitroreductase [Anoxybacter fermentans]